MQWWKEKAAFPLPGGLRFTLSGQAPGENWRFLGDWGSCDLEIYFNSITMGAQVPVKWGLLLKNTPLSTRFTFVLLYSSQSSYDYRRRWLTRVSELPCARAALVSPAGSTARGLLSDGSGRWKRPAPLSWSGRSRRAKNVRNKYSLHVMDVE